MRFWWRAFDKSADPAGALGNSVMMVKVCGITRREDAVVAAEAERRRLIYFLSEESAAISRRNAQQCWARG